MAHSSEAEYYELDPYGFGLRGKRRDYSGYDWTEWGARDKRTKADHPYSYSDHFIRRFVAHDDLKVKGVHSEYDDRMRGWDYDAWKRAIAKIPNKRFNEFTREDLSAFLTEYHGKPCDGLAISEGCNASNGYPYFVFYFRDKPVKRRRAAKPSGDQPSGKR